MVAPSSVRPHVGLEVTPSIRLIRPVGTGGMGSVWVAHHAGLETDVAVKFLLADLTMSEGAFLRFTDEASVAAQIKSPHVVQVYDHGILGGELPFIVMEFLEGQDLGARVRRGALDLAVTATVVQQLGQVLAKAHTVGIVHRDVKPENVFLLDGYGELFLKLIDFGIAKWITRSRSLTETGTMVGTPDFMCPEQILNAKEVGPAADLWGLAAVAYYCLVGRPPFARETLPATILAIEKGEFALPFARHGIGTPALDAFFLRALCRHQAGRFASLAELVGTFCEVAEVPLARSLRLRAGDDEAVPPSGVVAFDGERNGQGTQLNLPLGPVYAPATKLGPTAAARPVLGSQVATRLVVPAVHTLESGTAVPEALETESVPPTHARRTWLGRMGRRVIVALVALVSLAAGAWAWAAWAGSTTWTGEFQAENVRRLIPFVRRVPPAASPRAIAAPPREVRTYEQAGQLGSELRTPNPAAAQTAPLEMSLDLPPSAAPESREEATPPSPPTARVRRPAWRSPRPTRQSNATTSATPSLPAVVNQKERETVPPADPPPARNLKDRGF